MTNEPNAHIIRLSDLSQLHLDSKNKKIVLVGGCFDILHLGHVIFLEKARQLGGMLVVALESDRFIVEQKKRKPFHSQDQRAQILSSMRNVDLVVIMPYSPKTNRDQIYRDLVLSVKPKYIAVSEKDQMLKKKREHARQVSANVKVVSKLLTSLSSSTIAKYGALLSH